MTPKRTRAAKTRKNGADETTLHPPFAGITDAKKIAVASSLAKAGWTRENPQRGAITMAARAANVNRQTVYNWLETEEFVEAIESAVAVMVDKATQKLEKAVDDGNIVATIFLLKNLAPHVWDDQLRRDEAKRKHEVEQAAKANGGDGKDKPEPDFSFRETLPGERLVDDDEDPGDDE